MKRPITIVVVILLGGCATAPQVSENAATRLNGPIAGVRFDVHRVDATSLSVVARGLPGETSQGMQAALSAHIARICPSATSVTMDSPSEYEFLEGGNEFLMPAGGVFIPTKTYPAVKPPPLLHASPLFDPPPTTPLFIT